MSDWDESEHPRHPEGSGRRSGRFRNKTSGWVQVVADRLGLPSARKLLEDPDTNDIPQMAAFEGRYGRGGRMIVRDVRAHKIGGGHDDALSVFSPHGHLDISGEIASDDSDEGEGGYFRITATRSREEQPTDPLKWVAHIDRMHARSAGGAGGGRELTQRFIDWFRQSGFDEITVGPSEVGNYAWGAMGFDFHDRESRRSAWEGAMTMTVQSVRDWFRHEGRSYDLDDSDLTDAQIKKMIGQYKRAATVALAGGMSYQRLSQYGRTKGQDSSGWWAGKLGLLVGGVGGGRIKL